VANLSSFEVIVATLAAFPSTWWELALLFLLFCFKFITHTLLASIACLSSLEVVVETLVTVPSALWELEGCLFRSHFILLWNKWLGIWMETACILVKLRVVRLLWDKLLTVMIVSRYIRGVHHMITLVIVLFKAWN